MKQRSETIMVQAGRPTGPGSTLNTPLVLNSTFRVGGEIGYGRSGNDTWAAFEAVIGELEGGEAVAFSSGIAAAWAVLDLVPLGGVIVAPHSLYMGIWSELGKRATDGHASVRFVDITDTAAVVEAARGADMIWLESPTNPRLDIADIAAIAAAKDPTTLLAVDGTFTTPLLQQPLTLGAEIVMHSATKGIGGHADLLMGVVVAAAPLAELLREHRYVYGATPGALEAFLALRGVRTLSVRLERAQANAQAIAEMLVAHADVTYALYPGLPEHPGHALATRQMSGFGTIISFEVNGGAEAAARLCASALVFANATSLGGVESLIEVRGDRELERAMGTPPGLIRMSVGIEHIDDLVADLEQAISAAHAG